MKRALGLVVCLATASTAFADSLNCNLAGYSASTGLTASVAGEVLTLSWTGDPGQTLRLRLGITAGVPTIHELAIRRDSGAWSALITGATPEFRITSGRRRMSTQQASPLTGLGVQLTPEIIEYNKWDPFWDAPLDVPGTAGNRSMDLPRLQSEIVRATATYKATSCTVKSEGGRIEVTFPGAQAGVFTGELSFTIFKGTNLIRQELAAATREPSVAYKYDAGLKGLKAANGGRAAWRDIAGNWQFNRIGGAKNDAEVALRTSNRLIFAEAGGAGSIAFFPPPHTFFWPRELATNLGYSWVRNDGAGAYSLGIRQAEKEFGTQYQGNFALYSARPGTIQRMRLFLYPSTSTAEVSYQSALAFTHGDRYKPLPGYQVMNHHYHMNLGARLLEAGSLDADIPDVRALRALGINIVSVLTGGGGNGAAETDGLPDGAVYRGPGPLQPNARPPARNAPVTGRAPVPGANQRPAPAAEGAGRGGGRGAGPGPLEVRRASIEGARRNSDADFLVMPSQEAGGNWLGGHADLLFSKPTYWMDGPVGAPLVENHPTYGKVYHINKVEDLLEMARRENVMMSMPHPRTKGSTGFPDAIRELAPLNDAQYHGFGFRWGMGLDLSEQRLCEYRCLPLIDDMSNWYVNKPIPMKTMIAISEVRYQEPYDELYSSSPVSYVKLDRLPNVDDTTSIIQALIRGDSYVTSGEVLMKSYEVRGTGNQRTVVADLEWTFPLDMVEVVWGDGTTVGRQVITTKDLPPFGSKRFEIPLNTTGKSWVRFAAWDSAGNGATSQPTRLGTMPSTQ